jgi:hypothetical protein
MPVYPSPLCIVIDVPVRESGIQERISPRLISIGGGIHKDKMSSSSSSSSSPSSLTAEVCLPLLFQYSWQQPTSTADGEGATSSARVVYVPIGDVDEDKSQIGAAISKEAVSALLIEHQVAALPCLVDARGHHHTLHDSASSAWPVVDDTSQTASRVLVPSMADCIEAFNQFDLHTGTSHIYIFKLVRFVHD